MRKFLFCRNCGERTQHDRVTAGRALAPQNGMFARQSAPRCRHKYVCTVCGCELSNDILVRYGMSPDSGLD